MKENEIHSSLYAKVRTKVMNEQQKIQMKAHKVLYDKRNCKLELTDKMTQFSQFKDSLLSVFIIKAEYSFMVIMLSWCYKNRFANCSDFIGRLPIFRTFFRHYDHINTSSDF